MEYVYCEGARYCAGAALPSNRGGGPENSPAFDEKYTQELVLFRHTQGILFLWMSFHEHRQIPSGWKTMRDSSGFFRIKEMIYVDIQAFQCLMKLKKTLAWVPTTKSPSSASQEGAVPFCTF